ncbi:MAG: DoxX family protein [Deltaproteobacteria bacterium]|nr:DoxX family protein [Deltaproteobacteria bacterium]
MTGSLARFEPVAYAALRIVAGAMFLCHGLSKVLGWLGPAKEVGSQLWIGGVIELVAGGLIALGLFTRPAALIASGTMAVAYFQFHWKLGMDNWQWLPMVNKGELAVLYCFLFLLIALRGAGIASLDQLRGRR